MGEDDKRNRKFQYALTKAQVDFEFLFAIAIGMLAIAYTLLPLYKDNLLVTIAVDGLILLAVGSLVVVYKRKEQRFKDIKKEYIDI
jgi:cytochrome c oxidase assembly protein Cox11